VGKKNHNPWAQLYLGTREIKLQERNRENTRGGGGVESLLKRILEGSAKERGRERHLSQRDLLEFEGGHEGEGWRGSPGKN